MFRLQKYLWLLVFALAGVVPAGAASTAEKRSFNVAAAAFNLGNWAYAETNFALFLQKYPVSEQAAEAVLLEAQARFYLRQYDGALTLLAVHREQAGGWADQFDLWTGESQFAAGRLAVAAETFAHLAEQLPGSTNLFRATLREAEARARLSQWARVISLLQNPGGAFEQEIKAGTVSELAVAGYLILGEAQFAQRDFTGAQRSLEWLAPRELSPAAAWRRSHLQCRVQQAEGDLLAALASAEASVKLAHAAKDALFLSESIALQADILERSGRLAEAANVLKSNLAPDVPADRQRTAMLKIAELSLKLDKIAEAAQTLEKFLSQQTNTAANDTAWFTLGELRLKQFVADPADTNRLAEAEGCFGKLLQKFPESALAGKAWLDQGWCWWLRGRYAEGRDAFQKAAGRLPVSEDQAVARFKWADSQFALQDFSGALTNYEWLVENYSGAADIKERLLEPALYQSVRAALAAGDLAAATNALGKILTWYPQGFAGDRSLLLTGQGFSREKDPTRARELFARFEEMYPTNALAAEVRLAVARSFERENNWDAAITNYDAWLGSFTNHAGQPAVEFNRAWDNYRAGRDTNAFDLFTNFVAQFPAHPLALQAQWWIGDYFFQQGRFVDAEGNYRLVFLSTNWPPSELTYQAQMMAGRAALARYKYTDATNYFAKLAVNTNCSRALQFEATFACGDALMSRTDTDATNRPADLREAIDWFSSIAQKFPTNALAPAAWGRIGDCYKDLAAVDTNHFYELAANAYQQVLNLPQASVAARSQAKVGLGILAEKEGQTLEGDAQADRLRQALADYLDVVLGKGLGEGEQRDLFWVKEAGLKAFRLSAEDLRDWPQALNLCTNLAEAVPQLRPLFEAKAAKLNEHLANPKPEPASLTR